MDEFPSLAGQALIAMPMIGDARFERTVIYLCVHDAEGAMGVVVNKPDGKRTVGEVLTELELVGSNTDTPHPDALNDRLLLGGPVEKTRGFVLHGPHKTQDGEGREGTVAVSDDIHLSTRLDILRDIGNGTGPDQFLLALGFASWDAGQLDQEILQNVWLHAPMTAKALFGTPPELHYASSMSGLGVDLHQLSPVAGRG